MAPIRVVDTRELDTVASVTQTICCLPLVAALAVERSGADRVIPDAFTRGTEQ